MKYLVLILCIAGMLTVVGCSDGGNAGVGGGAGGGGDAGAPVNNLQAFVLNNCNQVKPFTEPTPIAAGASFPETQTANPETSVYTRKCLQ